MARIWFLTLAAICCGSAHAIATSAAHSNQQPDKTTYFIHGAVREPGVYKIEGYSSALKLIAMAGGLSDTHGATAFIIRRSKPTAATGSAIDPGDEYEVIRIDIAGLLKGEALKDVELSPGDILNVPPSEVFFIRSEANRISSFSLRQGLTVSQAISLFRVANNNKRVTEVTILRANPTTEIREEIRVNLDEVISGKAIDVLIKANDVIVIPGSRTGITTPPVDAPPKRVLIPCRGGYPCIAEVY